MTPSVKTRIAAAMVLVIAINAGSTALAWSHFERARTSASLARSAADRATIAATASARITQFVSSASAVDVVLSSSPSPEEISAAYGEMTGAENSARSALKRVTEVRGRESGRIARWDALVEDTYVWINLESQTRGLSFRMTRTAQGRYRASIASNIETPTRLASQPVRAWGGSVRRQGELLIDGELRTVINSAQQLAKDAAAREEADREGLRSVLIGGLLASLAASLVVAVWLYRTIARPLVRARSFAQRVTQGDLHAVIDSHTDDEIGALTRAVAEMKDTVAARITSMHEMAGAIIVTAEDVEAATHQSDDSEKALTSIREGANVLVKLANQLLEQ